MTCVRLLALIVLAVPPAVPGADTRDPVVDDAPERAASGAPLVALASSLRAVWPRLERTWREEALPGVGSRPSFGASSTLSRQIARGAPFELFLAADERSIEELPISRVIPGSEAVYARGALVLLYRAGEESPPSPAADAAPDALAWLDARLRERPSLRVAIPNPVHAPYGRAAREALTSAGLWPLEPARLIVGENASQALQFLRAGAVDVALVPRPLVGTEPPAELRARPIESHRHAPLVHRLVAVRGASGAALALGEWLRGPAAREILLAAGFDAPR